MSPDLRYLSGAGWNQAGGDDSEFAGDGCGCREEKERCREERKEKKKGRKTTGIGFLDILNNLTILNYLLFY